MALDLISWAIDALPNGLTDRVAGALGESTSATRDGMQKVIPAILGGATRFTEAPGGANALFDMMRAQGNQFGNVEQLEGLLQDPARRDQLLHSGSGILRSLFGSGAGPLATAISQSAGLRGSSATMLLQMGAPFVLGLLHHKARADGLDARGVASLLESHKDSIARANAWMPPAAEQVVAFEEPARRVAPVAVAETRRTNWFVPLAMLGILGLGGYAVSRMWPRPSHTVSMAPAVSEPVAPTYVPPPEPYVAPPARGGGPTMTPPAEAPAPPAVAAAPLQGTVNFATSRHDIDQSGQAVIERFAAALQANPNARVRVEGHTDTMGNDAINEHLAQRRGEAVKNDLIQRGIAPDRIVLGSHASRAPAASNDTDEGRAANRRADLTLILP